MEIHNISEDIVIKSVQKICEELHTSGNPGGLCLCNQCKLDTICYVLNRIAPQYIVSNRGMTRVDQDSSSGRQQSDADIAMLVYKGLRQVNHNKRPNALHDTSKFVDATGGKPVFDVPTIVGKIFDGITFAPVKTVTVTLYYNGEIVSMRNSNWENPFTLVANTPGSFTFWPAPIPAEKVGLNRVFECSITVESPEYEESSHFFNIPCVSTIVQGLRSSENERTFKVPDIYLFHPGEAEQNG